MKKIYLTLICIVTLLGCVGCGKNTTNLDMNKTEEVIEKSLKEMTDIEDSSLSDVYGLDLSLMEKYTFKQNSDGDLYAIIKTSNKVAIKEDMDGFFDKIKEFNTAYSPERLEILENRIEKEIGNYLIYIVATDAADIYNDILDSIE